MIKFLSLDNIIKIHNIIIKEFGGLQGNSERLELFESSIQHIKNNVEKCDIVIWDDISNKAGTEFEISHLLSMINSRIMNGKTNIYTSNINPEKLQDYLDIRLASRIATNSEKIQFNGGDKRGLTLDD